MRIITCNVNGLRSAHAKGFTDWMRRQKPDVACLQEIKAKEADLPKDILAPRGLHAFFHPAEKRGYSGVAIYAKREPDDVLAVSGKTGEGVTHLLEAVIARLATDGTPPRIG